MTPTDDLREEHRIIKQVILPVLEEICAEIESGRSVEQNNLEGFIVFVKEFIEKSHYIKEEIYFFPEMEKAGVGAKELITSLKKEHEEERQYINEIDKVIFEKEENRELSAMVEYSKAYMQLLTLHIDKEENELFPMADAYLSQTVQKDLLKSFENVDTGIIGPERQEELKMWLEGKTYVKPE
jgi:hemerythrin-like domain-containing protein